MHKIGVGIEFGSHREYPVISVFDGVESESAQKWLRQYPEQVVGVETHTRQRLLVPADADYPFTLKTSNAQIADELCPAS